jgi:hypothetical protein
MSAKRNVITWADFRSLLRSWWIIQIRAMFQVCDDGVVIHITQTHTHKDTHPRLHTTFCINSFLLKAHSISETGYYSFNRSSINIKKLCLIHSVKPITPRNAASRASSQFLRFGRWRKQNTLLKRCGVFNKGEEKEKTETFVSPYSIIGVFHFFVNINIHFLRGVLISP